MVKVIIFDIGGVVVKYPMTGIYRDVGRKFSVSHEKVREKYEELDYLISTNRITSREFWTRLAKNLEIVDARLLEKVWMKSFKKNVPLKKEVVKIIRRLKAKGYELAVLSNTIYSHEHIHRKLGHYKLFDKVFLSNRLGVIKPGKKIYRYCIERLKVKPEECVFIDDKQVNVEGARKVGINAILFKSVGQFQKELKHYL